MCDHNLVVISINILALSTIFTISSTLECRNEYESNNGEDENGMPALHRRLLRKGGGRHDPDDAEVVVMIIEILYTSSCND